MGVVLQWRQSLDVRRRGRQQQRRHIREEAAVCAQVLLEEHRRYDGQVGLGQLPDTRRAVFISWKGAVCCWKRRGVPAEALTCSAALFLS